MWCDTLVCHFCYRKLISLCSCVKRSRGFYPARLHTKNTKACRDASLFLFWPNTAQRRRLSQATLILLYIFGQGGRRRVVEGVPGPLKHRSPVPNEFIRASKKTVDTRTRKPHRPLPNGLGNHQAVVAKIDNLPEWPREAATTETPKRLKQANAIGNPTNRLSGDYKSGCGGRT